MRLRPIVVCSLAVAAFFASVGAPVGARQAGAPKAPALEVDKLWPQPLPNHWVYGSITGLAVDARDHLVVATRPASVAAGNEAGLMSNPPTAEHCCLAAPPILEFDPNGKLVASWGGPGSGFDWPISTGGIAIDAAGNLWITAAGVPEPAAAAAGATGVVPGANRGGGAAGGGAAAGAAGGGRAEARGAGEGGARGAGRGETVVAGAEGAAVAAARGTAAAAGAGGGPADAHVMKFSRDGKFLMQIGKAGDPGPKDSQTQLDKPADVAIDGGELYIADGGTHQRVVVFDAATGAFKRQWRGHGAEFQRVSSIAVSKDGQVYVGDRKGNKVQIFKKDGAFVKELAVAPTTTANGSVWDVNFSSDAAQAYLFVADGQNSTVRVFARATLAPLGTIGDGGRWPGRFYAVNNVAMDSKSNLFTGEGYEGKRVQRWAKALGQIAAPAPAAQSDLVMAPKFEVDPNFPKVLPKHWVTGMSVGVAVDEQDHVWMVHRPPTISANERGADQDPPTGECCTAAPPVMEFDQQGNLLRSWGGAKEGAPYEWPLSNHGLWIDKQGFVWIGANHNQDSHIVKFTKDGKFVAQFGKAGAPTNSNDPDNFGSPAKIMVDDARHEAYVADGYRNKRVVVIDTETGARKRYWGAYGNKPDDASLGRYTPGEKPTQQFRGPVHCAMMSVDDLVYVCDRQSNRVQVFTREGKFVNEMFLATKTGGDGSVWDIAFSKDPAQKWMFVADGKNERVYIVDRKKLELVSSFGDGGRQPGQWFGAHSIAIDSKGNLYTVETYEGRRLQKFVYKGEQLVPRWQGVPWPIKK